MTLKRIRFIAPLGCRLRDIFRVVAIVAIVVIFGRWAISTLSYTYHQHKNASSAQNATRQAVSTTPISTSQANETNDQAPDWNTWVWSSAGAEWALALISFFGIWAAFRTLDALDEATRANIKAADAAQQTADIALKQSATIDRAWLKATIRIVGPLTHDGTTLILPIVIDLENVGRSPATNASIWVALCSYHDFMDDGPLAIRDDASRQLRDAKLDTNTVFPGDKEAHPFNVTAATPSLAPQKPGFTIPDEFRSIFSLALVGFVDYQFASSPIHHQTGFMYDVYWTIAGVPSFHTFTQNPFEAPADALQLRRRFTGGFYAD